MLSVHKKYLEKLALIITQTGLETGDTQDWGSTFLLGTEVLLNFNGMP